MLGADRHRVGAHDAAVADPGFSGQARGGGVVAGAGGSPRAIRSRTRSRSSSRSVSAWGPAPGAGAPGVDAGPTQAARPTRAVSPEPSMRTQSPVRGSPRRKLGDADSDAVVQGNGEMLARAAGRVFVLQPLAPVAAAERAEHLRNGAGVPIAPGCPSALAATVPSTEPMPS